MGGEDFTPALEGAVTTSFLKLLQPGAMEPALFMSLEGRDGSRIRRSALITGGGVSPGEHPSEVLPSQQPRPAYGRPPCRCLDFPREGTRPRRARAFPRFKKAAGQEVVRGVTVCMVSSRGVP